MTDYSVRADYWRELRKCVNQAKAAGTIGGRDEALDRACEWAEKLAASADQAVEEPFSAYFISETLEEVGEDGWVHPLTSPPITPGK